MHTDDADPRIDRPYVESRHRRHKMMERVFGMLGAWNL
jgi:hypothetical protein